MIQLFNELYNFIDRGQFQMSSSRFPFESIEIELLRAYARSLLVLDVYRLFWTSFAV